MRRGEQISVCAHRPIKTTLHAQPAMVELTPPWNTHCGHAANKKQLTPVSAKKKSRSANYHSRESRPRLPQSQGWREPKDTPSTENVFFFAGRTTPTNTTYQTLKFGGTGGGPALLESYHATFFSQTPVQLPRLISGSLRNFIPSWTCSPALRACRMFQRVRKGVCTKVPAQRRKMHLHSQAG